MNSLKHSPKIHKRDVYGKGISKYIVMDEANFNIGEFDTKIEAMELHFKTPKSKVFKFLIYELLK